MIWPPPGCHTGGKESVPGTSELRTIIRLFAWLLRLPSLAAFGFLVVAAVMVTNALYLQHGPHPAPMFETRGAPSDTRAPAPQTLVDPLVFSAQQALKQAGYYDGPVDGLVGPMTRSAVMAFQRNEGREATGEINAALVAAIRPAPAPVPRPDPIGQLASGVTQVASQSAAPAAPVEAPRDEQVAAVQDALARSAYGQLTPDGIYGPATRDAVMRFQRDHALPVTGEIDDSLIVELRATGAMASD